MKNKILLTLLILGITVGVIYRKEVLAVEHTITNYSPCNTPKPYKIGVIDERFGISKLELENDLAKSTKIWSDSIGKPLFIYDPTAKLTIDLTYDTRQELNSEINKIDSNIKLQKSQLDPKIEDYKRRSANFEARLKAFNTEVQKWNRQGGATEEVYNKLINDQKSLRAEADSLNALSRELGQSTEQYNQEVTNLNSTINNFDVAIQGRPEEGLYTRDSRSETITIFIYNSYTELIHTLTHEFGHSLGLEHTKSTNSIMFAKTNNSIMPQKEDIDQLNLICRERFIGEAVFDYYRKVFEVIAPKIRSRLGFAS